MKTVNLYMYTISRSAILLTIQTARSVQTREADNGQGPTATR